MSNMQIGSEQLERPWSKHSKGSSAYLKLHPEDKKKKEKDNKEEEDKKKTPNTKIDKNNPVLLEFLDIRNISSFNSILTLWYDCIKKLKGGKMTM